MSYRAGAEPLMTQSLRRDPLRSRGASVETRKGADVLRQEGVKALVGARSPADAVRGRRDTPVHACLGEPVSVVIYIVLTVAIFAVLGVVQKLVERL